MTIQSYNDFYPFFSRLETSDINHSKTYSHARKFMQTGKSLEIAKSKNKVKENLYSRFMIIYQSKKHLSYKMEQRILSLIIYVFRSKKLVALQHYKTGKCLIIQHTTHFFGINLVDEYMWSNTSLPWKCIFSYILKYSQLPSPPRKKSPCIYCPFIQF